jgi:hypothetical protein
MIMTVAELRQFMDTDEKEQVLEARLQALELSIRAYTNNNFQKRAFRAVAVAMSDGTLIAKEPVPFRVGDTLQITESELMQDQLVTVTQIDGGTITVNEPLYDESGVVITKVEYPLDVKMGVANLMKWELERRDKVGIASESISRHSVTYYDMSKENSSMGYPIALLGFLKPYKRARFGRGINT